jgi:hypothetical protein
MCAEDLVEFHYSLNGSAMVKKYYVDPYTMSNDVLCDGRVYTAKEFDKRRACTNNPPMTDTSAAGVRRWYEAFTKHCNSHGIYIHPYALFQKGYGGTKGFKAGGDSSNDLPIQFVSRIVSHSLVISKMISGTDVIPAKSIYSSLRDNSCGDGYEALFSIVQQNYPVFADIETQFIRSAPNQQSGSNVANYLLIFQDWLAMRALVTNEVKSLNNEHTLDMFLTGCTYGRFFQNCSREERKAGSTTAHKYKADSILSTLLSFERYPDFPGCKSTNAPPKTRGYYKNNPSKIFDEIQLHAVNVDRHDIVPDSCPPDDSTPDTPIVTVNLVTGNLCLDDICVHDEAGTDVELGVIQWKHCVNQVQTSPVPASKMPCILCGGVHSFDNCPVAKNVEYLKDFHVRCCQAVHREMLSRRRIRFPSIPPPVYCSASDCLFEYTSNAVPFMALLVEPLPVDDDVLLDLKNLHDLLLRPLLSHGLPSLATNGTPVPAAPGSQLDIIKNVAPHCPSNSPYPNDQAVLGSPVDIIKDDATMIFIAHHQRTKHWSLRLPQTYARPWSSSKYLSSC